MSIKLLISGESNSGKTTLTKNLKDSLVISHDGKSYPFPVPHVMVENFDDIKELINIINDKILTYKTKFGKYPKTIVFDSISKIFETMLNRCNEKYKGFAVYTNLDMEIAEFMDYIQTTLIASDMNVIIISHAIFNQDTTKYNLVGKGSFNKKGGVLAETDEAIFIETKSNKRIAHLRSIKFPARTLTDSLPDSINVNEFNLQEHLDTLATNQSTVDDYAI